MKFNIYNRFAIKIIRKDNRWLAFRTGVGARVPVEDLVVPAELSESELIPFLDDMYHELAIPGRSIEQLDDNGTDSDLNGLIRLALSSGASEAKIISPYDIPVDERLAEFCNPSQCESYGLSPSCPPHVSGPSGFRILQQNALFALVLRIAVPSSALFSAERREVFSLLHESTAGIEQTAAEMGYPASKAFAGGSCKKIFCNDHPVCRVLSEGGRCRYSQHARPSMSGFGIDVSELMTICGWPSNIDIHAPEAKSDPMSWVAGLVLIG
ncbi:MAG: DUF2284 domain-containing protein [Desulfobacterales bacterium]